MFFQLHRTFPQGSNYWGTNLSQVEMAFMLQNQESLALSTDGIIECHWSSHHDFSLQIDLPSLVGLLIVISLKLTQLHCVLCYEPLACLHHN